jgi:uncharacterized protein YqfB (UPF0267 family)
MSHSRGFDLKRPLRHMLCLPFLVLLVSCSALPSPTPEPETSFTVGKNMPNKTEMPKQRLFFAREFMPQIRSGKKQITIRQGTRNYRPGQRVIAKCSDEEGVLIEITECKQLPLREVPQQDLRDDNLQSTEHALQSLRRWYSDLTLDSTVSVIRFRLCP